MTNLIDAIPTMNQDQLEVCKKKISEYRDTVEFFSEEWDACSKALRLIIDEIESIKFGNTPQALNRRSLF